MSRLVVAGDVLLDRDLDGRAERLAPDAPVPVVEGLEEHVRPGGAGLAAALAAAAGHDVTLICALGADAAGERLRELLAAAGVSVCDLGLRGSTPEKVRVRTGGRALLRLDYGDTGGGSCGSPTAAARAALSRADGVLVSDYGRGVAAEPGLRAALVALRGIPIVWDPHPRGPAPIPGCLLVTPNAEEAARAVAEAARASHGAADAAGTPGGRGSGPPSPPPGDRGSGPPSPPLSGSSGDRGSDPPSPAAFAAVSSPGGRGSDPPSPSAAPSFGDGGSGPPSPLARHEEHARALRLRWGAVDVCVTLGARGALLVGAAGAALAVPAEPAAAGDPCGAGDCFAATAAGRLADGSLPSEAVRAAVAAASAFVAAGGAAAWARGATRPAVREDAAALAARVRAAGGTVVATGGCFDLLHAGHVRTLTAARALGDCLIVCLNSDASVRRLKGPERPLVEEHDRAAVLEALACVDAVAVFEEDVPSDVLRILRPHLWAKGGDYAVADLPEAEVLAEWGGRAVVVPYVAGRSTTRLIDEARRRAGEEVAHVR